MKYSFILYSFILFFTLIVLSCSRSIVIPDVLINKPSYTMFGKIPQRNFYLDQNLSDSLKLKWQVGLNGGLSNTSVTVYDDYVFSPDLSGRIYSFKISDGQRIGYMSYKGSVIPAPVLNGTKLIYALAELKGNGSKIYYYDFKSGKELEEIEVDGKIHSELLKTEQNIVAVTEEGIIYCYDLSGRRQWEYDTESFIHSSPALWKNSVILGNDKGEIISINEETGRLNFRKKTGSGFEGGFTSVNDTIFAADNEGVLYSLNASDGNLFWKYNCGSRITAVPVMNDSFIYIGNLSGKIFKINKNGKEEWSISTGGVINVTPLLFKNTLVQPDFNKKLYLIDTATGFIKKIIRFDDRVKLSPVYVNNILFLGTDNGKLYAYETVD